MRKKTCSGRISILLEGTFRTELFCCVAKTLFYGNISWMKEKQSMRERERTKSNIWERESMKKRKKGKQSMKDREKKEDLSVSKRERRTKY